MNRKISLFVVMVVLSLTAVAAFLVRQLEFDYNFESFFPQNDPETEFYDHFRNVFTTDNDYILIGLRNEPSVFEEDFLKDAQQIHDQIASLPDVTAMFSLLDSIEVRTGLFGEPYFFPPIKVAQPETYSLDSVRILDHPRYVESLISKDAKSMVLWLNHTQGLSKERCDSIANSVQHILADSGVQEYHTAGRAIGQQEYIEMMKWEMLIFMTLSFFLILIFLFLAFRSVWGVAVPVTIVLLAIFWNLAAIKLLGHEIDLMLTILPTILFVVGMSDAVHITTKYLEELRLGKSKQEAIKKSLREVGLATLLTSVTTAVGFLSLLTSNIQPVSRFGLHTAIGVILAFLLSYSILPVVFFVMKKPSLANRRIQPFDWAKYLAPAYVFVLKKRGRLLLLFAGLFGLSMWGVSLVVSDNFLLEDIKKDHPLRQEIAYFEDHFAGARPLEIAIKMDHSQELDLDLLQDMDALDNYLIQEFGMGALLSPVQLIKSARQMIKGGEAKHYQLPKNKRELNKILKLLGRNDALEVVWNQEAKLGRINGQTPDLGRRYYAGKIDDLHTFMDTELNEAPFDIKVTGTARLMDLNNENLSRTMIWGLLIAFGIIALIVGLMFKSIKMVLVSLVPNVLPLLFVGGIMGFAGIPLKVSTSIIFTIAFGIAVDDTIHFLSKYRIELSKGKSQLYALKRTFLSTGKAIIVTTGILCGGFLILLFSDFLGTYYIGLLIGMTLLFAVLSDLFLLPVLLLWIKPAKSNQ